VLFVPMCGYDCIPTDLGTFLLVEHCREMLKKGVKSVKVIVSEVKGGISGGTLSSMCTSVDQLPLKTLQNPLIMCPGNSTPMHRFDSAAKRPWPMWSNEFNCWTVPSMMAGVDEQCIRRSASLASPAYGTTFLYTERHKVSSFLFGCMFSSLFTLAMLFIYFRFTRSILLKFLPKPGDGPSKKVRESGYFVHRLVAETEDGQRVYATVRGIQDPGYAETAKMLSESALALCFNRAELPAKGGVLTPSLAFGNVIVQRLRAAGMTFAVDG